MDMALEQLADSLRRTGLLSDLDFESACSELSATGDEITADRLLERLTERGRHGQNHRLGFGSAAEFLVSVGSER